MTLSTLDNALWAASLIGHVALVVVMVVRKRWREFPVFTCFLAYEALTTIVLYLTSRYGAKQTYFNLYWITGFANYVLQVAILYEIARDVLRPTGTWVRDARKSLLGWCGAGLLAAAALAMQIKPPQSTAFELWDTRIEVFTSLLICALFLAMSAAANRLGLQRRNHVVALGQGLFIFAFAALLEEFGHALLGWDRQFVIFLHIRECVYMAVLIYWTVAFWLPEQARAPLSAEMRAYLLALHERVQYDLTSVNGPHL